MRRFKVSLEFVFCVSLVLMFSWSIVLTRNKRSSSIRGCSDKGSKVCCVHVVLNPHTHMHACTHTHTQHTHTQHTHTHTHCVVSTDFYTS